MGPRRLRRRQALLGVAPERIDERPVARRTDAERLLLQPTARIEGEVRFRGYDGCGGQLLAFNGVTIIGPLCGSIIAIKGKLVRADHTSGWKWISSLSRKDTGKGACEIVWVEKFKIVEQ